MATYAPSIQKLLPTDIDSTTTIRKLTSNITIVNIPFQIGGTVKAGGRTTICRMHSGRLAVFSPTPLIQSVETAVAEMGGNVSHLIAPNKGHHLFLGQWKTRYPNAKIIGPIGLPEKRAKSEEVDQVGFDTVIGEELDEESDSEFAIEFLNTYPNSDIVFDFIREKTLIEGDVWFNVPALEQYSSSNEDPKSGLPTKLVTHINQAPGDSWTGRMKWFVFTGGNQESLARSVKAIQEWPFERIVPCHGDVLENDAKAKWKSLFPRHYIQNAELARD
ncbi:MAG: hypothetical protein M1820_005115 [Bogoriella megaspora]|nr:MAG: hypothetical protein M1820_005115 [Bogoriella megaspora]